MNSHFQSSEATWTRSGFTVDAIGLRGLKSCEPSHATPPTRNTVMAGIDQTSISRRPEYLKFGRYRARSFDARNQKATPSVARITGITIASMMPSELKRTCRSAEAIGPLGSSTPSLQPPSAAAPIRRTANRRYRILDLTCPDIGCDWHRHTGSDVDPCIMRQATGWRCVRATIDADDSKQHEQIGDGENE